MHVYSISEMSKCVNVQWHRGVLVGLCCNFPSSMILGGLTHAQVDPYEILDVAQQ